jgi:hypothetical protein
MLGCVRYSPVQIPPPDPAYRKWAEVAAGVLVGTGRDLRRRLESITRKRHLDQV